MFLYRDLHTIYRAIRFRADPDSIARKAHRNNFTPVALEMYAE